MTVADQIMTDFNTIKFIPSDKFSWSPEDNVVFFNGSSSNSEWSLLHEVGHVQCRHNNYASDLGLLKMEVEAWQKARQLAKKYAINIDESHIDKCVDSYRDWLYRRSSCPNCTQAGVEKTLGQYICINCKNQWKVTAEKFCRVYRRNLKNENRS